MGEVESGDMVTWRIGGSEWDRCEYERRRKMRKWERMEMRSPLSKNLVSRVTDQSERDERNCWLVTNAGCLFALFMLKLGASWDSFTFLSPLKIKITLDFFFKYFKSAFVYMFKYKSLNLN